MKPIIKDQRYIRDVLHRLKAGKNNLLNKSSLDLKKK